MSVKALLSLDKSIVAPGVYDALTARIAARYDFPALYLSGAAIAHARLGYPDIGLTTMSEVYETLALIHDSVDVPLIVDADTGYGNALNVQRTVRLLEKAGASAIQLEDQSFPKRCGHLRGKSLVSCDEMVGKIQAAVDARRDEDTVIIARTDAIAAEGFGAAMERAERYVEAGADALFIEAPRTHLEIQEVCTAFSRRIPLLANVVEGGDTPPLGADDLECLGFRIIIFPGGIARAVSRTAVDYYSSLKMHRSNLPFKDRMYDFQGLNDLIGTRALLELGEAYAAETHAKPQVSSGD